MGMGTPMGAAAEKPPQGAYTTNSAIEGMSNLMGRINDYGQLMN
jgi:hypothetical protein